MLFIYSFQSSELAFSVHQSTLMGTMATWFIVYIDFKVVLEFNCFRAIFLLDCHQIVSETYHTHA